MIENLLMSIWGCIPEISKDCTDMTNSSSTYFGAVIGAVIGAFISWLIYNRQKKTSDQQDIALDAIQSLQIRQTDLLKQLEKIDERHESMLRAIAEMDKRLAKMLEEKGKSQ